MNASQTLLDNTANNLANVNTPGFKTGSTTFEDLVYVTLRPPGAQLSQGLVVPTGLQIGSGTKVSATSKLFTQGALEQTNQTYNVAIQGNGFFKVLMPDGSTQYTRAGNLQVDANGTLVTSDGYPIEPSIKIPSTATSVSIGADGTVSVISAGNPNQSTTLGTLQLATFLNPQGLSSQGSNLYAVTSSSGSPNVAAPGQQGAGTLVQGYLESSNVNSVQELSNLIQTQQSYAFNSHAIQVANEMLEATYNLTK